MWRDANGSYDPVDLNHASALKQISSTREGSVIRLELMLNEPSSSESSKTSTRADLLLQLRQAFINRYSATDLQNVVMANEIPLLSVDATAEGINALLADPQVLGFSEPRYYQDLMLNVNTLLQAPQLPPMRAFGQSQYSIGIIDSGVDYNHPGLGDRPFLAGGCSSTSESGFPSICNAGGAGLPCAASATYNVAMFGCGHGTHVAGIALGQFGNSAFNGLAPNLGLLSYQASSLGLDSSAEPARRYQNIDVQNALNWMIAQARSKPGGKTLAALNMSFGTQDSSPEPSPGDPTPPDRSIRDAIIALRAGNTTPVGQAFEPVLVVAAAGNAGKNSLGFPATLPEVISVGGSTRSDRQQSYSAVTSPFGGEPIKLFAPGGTDVAFLNFGTFQFDSQNFTYRENDWSTFTALIGAAGAGLTNVAGVNPETVLSQQIPVDSMSLNPSSSSAGFANLSGGIAFRGSDEADAPYLLITANASNRRNIRVQYWLYDIDGINNSVQAVALQYRTSLFSNFVNVPLAFVADATQVGTDASNFVNVFLPAIANNASFLQLRIITANAPGTDEWVAINQINVSSESLVTPQALVFGTCGITVDNGVGSVCSAKPGGGFSIQEGTSMAAPQVTGILARLRDRFPQLSVTQVEELLLRSGLPITASVGNQTYVVPRIRPLQAYEIASKPRAFTSTVVSSNCTTSQISWQIPEIMQAIGYRYRTAVDFGALAAATITTVPNTISQIINVPTGHTLVQILAFDSQGDGSWSDPVLILRAPCVPATISNLVADRIGTGPGHFCWGSIANATSYQMEDQPLGSAFTGRATVDAITDLNHPGSLDPFNFPDVKAKVRACNLSGCGGWSPEAQLTDRDIMSLPPPDFISPCSSL